MKILEKYTTVFYAKNGRNRKCRVCGKMIISGDLVVVTKYQVQNFYPVKGIMKFNRWNFAHEECENELQV